MAALSDTKKKQIQEVIFNAGKQWVPAQELTHVYNKIIDSPTQETVNSMISYLDKFPYRNMGQPDFMPIYTTTAMTNNDMRYAMAEVMKIINS